MTKKKSEPKAEVKIEKQLFNVKGEMIKAESEKEAVSIYNKRT